MTSYIQKALAAEKKRRSDHSDSKRSIADAAIDLAASSGIFKGLLGAAVQEEVMERNKVLPEIDDRAAVTAYKMLRTRVLQRMRSNNWHTLIVSGAGPSEGKSITAINLALSISHDVNQSVVLVDLDLQRSTIANYFGLDATKGIGEFLANTASIDEIVYSPANMERIAIIPNLSPVANSSELIASPRMRGLLDWVKNRGENNIAIFDMPPILATDDVLSFAPSADALLMVVSEGQTERSSLARALEMVEDNNLLGVVLNRSREWSSSAYY